jgi:hypothetical protein
LRTLDKEKTMETIRREKLEASNDNEVMGALYQALAIAQANILFRLRDETGEKRKRLAIEIIEKLEAFEVTYDAQCGPAMVWNPITQQCEPIVVR